MATFLLIFFNKNCIFSLGAVKLLKDEAKKEIRSKGFGSKFAPGTSTYPWSHKQLWTTMQLLVERGFVPYDELLFTVFEGNETALKALAEKHLISFNKVGDKKAVSSLKYFLFLE